MHNYQLSASALVFTTVDSSSSQNLLNINYYCQYVLNKSSGILLLGARILFVYLRQQNKVEWSEWQTLAE